MANNVNTESTEQVLDWIRTQARSLSIPITTYPNSLVRDGNWMHVPVTVDKDGDAYERASLLQQIEDAWDASKFGGVQLLLVPARPSALSKEDLYEMVGDLMKKQHVLLDQIDKEGADSITIERFNLIRREWEETLEEMGRLYPSLARRVA